MSLTQVMQKARAKVRQANSATTKEAKAKEKIRRAKTKGQLEQARMELRIAKMDRQQKELTARTAWARANAEVDKARAAASRASDEKWQARYRRLGTISAPARSFGKAAGKGLFNISRTLWKETTSSPTTRRRVATKRKTTAKRRR